jgi:ribosomal protein L7/L12
MFRFFRSPQERNVSDAAYRLAQLERKIDLILDHLGIEHHDDFEEQLVSLLAQGQKIQAIKVYREATGSGLKDAKDAVEAIAARRGL